MAVNIFKFLLRKLGNFVLKNPVNRKVLEACSPVLWPPLNPIARKFLLTLFISSNKNCSYSFSTLIFNLYMYRLIYCITTAPFFINL